MKKINKLNGKHQVQAGPEFDNQLKLTGQYVLINDLFTEKMPKIKRAGLKLANFLDIIKGRNPEYNKNEEDLKKLSKNSFFLAGNPIIGNEDGNEQIIITNLEHEKVSSIKELVYSLSNKSRLNRNSNMLVGQELFESLKNIPGATYLIPKQMMESGKQWQSYGKRYAFENTSQRQEFYEALAQGETQILKEYTRLVRNLKLESTTKKPAPKTIRSLLPFTVNEPSWSEGSTEGLRFPYIFDMLNSDFRIVYNLRQNGNSNILCKIPNNLVLNGKVSFLSSEEMKILTAYRKEEKFIKTEKGIYVLSNGLQIK